MHIVISSKYFFPIIGGSIIYASMLAEEFTRAGHRVTVVTRTSHEQGESESKSYKLVRNPNLRQKFRIAADTDIFLQVDASWQDAYPYLFLGIPWFPTIHRGKPSFQKLNFIGKIRLVAEHLAYKLGNSIAVSETTANSWNLKSAPIPNPYDSGTFQLPHGQNYRDIDILYVGSLVRHKGIFVLMEALEKIDNNSNSTPLNVVFVGEGREQGALEKLIKKSPHNVLVAGPAPASGVASWMQRSRILAFPTTPEWLEASPLTPLEGAACGCLVVAADSGGTAENVSTSHWIIESGSTSALVTALQEALEKPSGFIAQPTLDLLRKREIASVCATYLSRFKINN